MSTNSSDVENRSWLFAAVIMALVALAMFFVQHFVVQVFDVAVEISVFYIPAIALVIFYLSRRLLQKSSH